MVDTVVVPASPDVVVEQPVVSQEETRALDEGWMTKDKWIEAGNDESTHRSAREFNDRGELLRKISEQNRYIQRTNEGIEQLRYHNQRVYENAYNKALVDLKAQHSAAVEAGEIAKADRLVDEIANTKATAAANAVSQRAAATQQTLPELEVWKARNRWYDEDEDARTFADGIAAKYIREQGTTVAPADVLKYVETKVRAKLLKPEVKTAAPNPVAGVGPSPSKGSASSALGFKKGDMNEDELKAMKNFVAMKLGSEADYMRQLADVR